jgi:Ca2+-binding RTX toxin-like protein
VSLTSTQIAELRPGFQLGIFASGTSPVAWSFALVPQPGTGTLGTGALYPLALNGDSITAVATVQWADDYGDHDTSTITINLIGQPQGSLFTTGADEVDFNSLTPAQQQAIAGGAETNNGMGGNDVVMLPDLANYNESVGKGKTLGWNPDNPFSTDSLAGESYQITGGDGTDNIELGAGNDTVYGSPGNDAIRGGAGADVFDYQDGRFANFRSFGGTTGLVTTNQFITGEHALFEQDPSKQNLLKLPGAPNDYTFSVSLQLDNKLADTITKISSDNPDFPSVTLTTTDVEKAVFAQPLNSDSVDLSSAANSIPVEMLQLASQVYADGYSTLGGKQSDPLAYQANAIENEAAAAEAQGWHAVAAMELGMAPADFGQGSLKYSFVNGVYQAIDPADSFLGNFPEADAMVLSGMMNGQRTLAIVFRGTDQIADIGDYISFATHYAKFAPLIDRLRSYLSDSANGIQQVLVSGHSLGAPMVDYFMKDFPNTSQYTVTGYTDGYPGVEDPAGDTRIENFIHTKDVVAELGNLSNNPVLLASVATALAAVVATVSPLAAGAVFSTIDSAKPKSDEGTNILIDSDIPTTFPNLLGQHFATTYVQDATKLAQFARDPLSPFMSSPLGRSLLSNDPSISLSPTEIAVGMPGSNLVHVKPGDNYVLGYDPNYNPFSLGDTIVWDAPSTRDTLHIVDGGLAHGTGSPTINTVELHGGSSDYNWVPLGNGETLLFYLQGSPGLIGDLYRVQYLLFDPSLKIVPLTQANVAYVPGTPGQPLIGGHGAETLDGRGLTDQIITGGDGAETLIGGSHDKLIAGKGQETIVGGSNDTIVAGNGKDLIFAGVNNTVTVGNGDNTVYGSTNDVISVGNGNNLVVSGDSSTVTLGNGNNTVSVGSNDTIVGGRGSDTFSFASSSGTDVISGFNADIDRVVVSLSYAISSFDALQPHMQSTPDHTGTMINLDKNDTITLAGVAPSGLHAGNFSFA